MAWNIFNKKVDPQEELLKEQARAEIAAEIHQEKLSIYKEQIKAKELAKLKKGSGFERLSKIAAKVTENAAREFGYDKSKGTGLSGIATKADNNLNRMLGRSSPGQFQQPTDGFDPSASMKRILAKPKTEDRTK